MQQAQTSKTLSEVLRGEREGEREGANNSFKNPSTSRRGCCSSPIFYLLKARSSELEWIVGKCWERAVFAIPCSWWKKPKLNRSWHHCDVRSEAAASPKRQKTDALTQSCALGQTDERLLKLVACLSNPAAKGCSQNTPKPPNAWHLEEPCSETPRWTNWCAFAFNHTIATSLAGFGAAPLFVAEKPRFGWIWCPVGLSMNETSVDCLKSCFDVVKLWRPKKPNSGSFGATWFRATLNT